MNDVLVSRLSRRAPMIERLALWPDMIIGLSHRLCLFCLLSSGGGGDLTTIPWYQHELEDKMLRSREKALRKLGMQ